jgi:FlaA1/EpsC-like NDP-sugar epimerase
MSRVTSRALQILLDLAALSLAFGLAFVIRFDSDIPRDMVQRCLLLLPYVIALEYACLHAFDVPKFAWRYIGLREVVRILQALAFASALLLVVRIAAGQLGGRVPILHQVFVPAGVLAINFIVAFCAIVGIRSLRRVWVERAGKVSRREAGHASVPTMLIGAGHEGLLVAKELEARPELGMTPVGFLDDDALKLGTMVHGIPVVGTTAQLDERCKDKGATQVLITMADAPGKEIRRIVRIAEQASLPAKIIPGLHEIVGGRVDLSVRNVAIEDLLRREPVRLDEDAIAKSVRGRPVLVTGAGGSIGSELCRQICGFRPRELIMVERAENALFEIHRELLAKFPDVELVPAIADICDQARMGALMSKHRPRLVMHAAAHKHVPMMEWNPGEAVKNNVVGTKTVADLADRYGVERFVLVSTDKAVNPTSIMGATKRVAELYVQALSSRSACKYVAVRFGNVLGSAGSVIPIFTEQIAHGGPVTVTHPEMRRYFMTIPEASQLVLQAATMGKGAEIFILDMGEPVLISDLAEDLIRLSGLRPGEDIEIQFTGIRPGEKLFEELSVADESAEKTYHPKIFVGRIEGRAMEALSAQLGPLLDVAESGDLRAVQRALKAIVPELEATEPDSAARARGMKAGPALVNVLPLSETATES